jgi:hypothetical protein
VSLPDPDHIPPGPGRPQEQSLTTTSIVIYATLILLALTIPRGLANWSRNFDPNPLQQLVQEVALRVQSASRDLFLDRPYIWGRDLFLRMTSKRDE